MVIPQEDKINSERLGHLPEELAHFDINEVNRSISDRFELQVSITPNNTALKSRSQSLTYIQLNKRANKLAHAILARKNADSATVASFFGHEVNSIVGFFGILKAGKIFVPLDPTYNPERIAYSLEDSLAKILVTDDENLEQAHNLIQPGQIIINVDDLDVDLSEDNLGVRIYPESAAHITYTSGSTGKPKGVVSDHRKLNHRAHYFEPEDKLTHLFSISFIASLDDIFGALMHGAALCIYDFKREGIAPLADWLIDEKITYFRPPSALLRQFNDLLGDNVKFPKITRFSLGGQAVYTQEVKRLLERCSLNCIAKIVFASTEAGRIAQFHLTAETEIESDIVPVGYPAIGMGIKIIDENGKELGPNQEGEIVLKSNYFAKEYWRDPELTKQKFLPDPDGGDMRIMHTGDLGKISEDGLLEHLGRKDFQVKVRGYRIEISAIEAHLQKLAAVKEVVVVPQEGNRIGDKYLAAYIVPERESLPTVRSLRDSMTAKLANHMIPARFVFIEKMPLTITGKINRKALPIPAPERPDLGNAYVAPSDELQKKLAKIWEDILSIKPVGIHDNFFDLGGDSLMAAQLFVDIEKVFGKKLPLSILYKASNVKEQVEILQKEDVSDEWSVLVKVQSNGRKSPLFCFPGKGGNPIRFRHLSQRLGKEQPVYMLQSRGISGTVAPHEKLEDIAAEYKQAIQEVQPNGPYYLMGSSGGGKVAYEIAQQLLEEDQQVNLLAFVDTYGPGYPQRLPSTSLIKPRINKTMQYIGKHVGNLRVASWRGKASYIVRYMQMGLRRAMGLPGQFFSIIKQTAGPGLPPELIEVERANLAAGKNYVPQPYPGTVTMFRAEQQPWGILEDSLLGWGDVGIENLVIHEVPGHHGSILFEPRVSNIVDVLTKLLEQ